MSTTKARSVDLTGYAWEHWQCRLLRRSCDRQAAKASCLQQISDLTILFERKKLWILCAIRLRDGLR
jgi:hypothetical protein